MSRPPELTHGLPSPDPAMEAHSARVGERIREEIRTQGRAIPFSRYMELALHAPGLGYYSAGLAKFGSGGDFVTAPEISPIFSRCLAGQVAEALASLDGGDVLELGAGTGAMAVDVLAQMGACGILPRRYLILETSANLRRRQHEALRARAGGLVERVHWLDHLPDAGFRGVVLANEVLDALPACRFRRADEEVQEFVVDWQGGRFVWAVRPAQEPGLADAVEAVENSLGSPLPAGYVSEVRLSQGPWIDALAKRMERGMVLLLDYGYPRREYYHPQRSDGTLLCYYRHHVHGDPLILPGLQDISVHVEFTSVAESAMKAGLELAGFTTQAEFLLASGIIEQMPIDRTGSREHFEFARQIKRLILPGEMGELVKVLGLSKGTVAPLSGFKRLDLRNRL